MTEHSHPKIKIMLKAHTYPVGVRLTDFKVVLADEATATHPRTSAPLGRHDATSLLAFFAHYKLHAVLKKADSLQLSERTHSWVHKLWNDLGNCRIGKDCWLRSVFGPVGRNNEACYVHKVITKGKRNRAEVVWLGDEAPAAEEITLTLDGTPANNEQELHDLLCRLRVTEGMDELPKSEEHKIRPNPASSDVRAGATDTQRGLSEQFKGEISVRFPNCWTAQEDFKRECGKCLASTGKLRIKWFGMGMEYGAPFLPHLLLSLVESVQQCDIHVSIAMLDPTFEHLGLLHSDWPKEVRKSYDKLSVFAMEYGRRGDKLDRRKVKVALGTYKYVPNWHGFAINDSRFYISTCSWKESPPGSGKKHIVGGENPYILAEGKKGGIESWIVATFNGWFECAFNWSDSTSAKKPTVGRKRH